MHTPFKLSHTNKLTSRAVLATFAISAVLLVGCGKKEEWAGVDSKTAAPAAAADAAEPQSKTFSNGNTSSAHVASADVASAEVASVAKSDIAKPAAVRQTQLTSTALTAAPAGRQLVRTADMNFSVKDVYAAAVAIEDAVAASEGFVAASSIAEEQHHVSHHRAEGEQMLRVVQYSLNGTMTVRVPSAKMQSFLRDIAKHMESLSQRNFTATDVQFDILRKQSEAQRNNEAQAELGMLARQPGRAIEAGYLVQSRLEALAARNEALVAQKEMADQVAFSTIRLSMTQPSQVRKSTQADVEAIMQSYKPHFLMRVGSAVARGWNGLLGLLEGLIAIWPLILVLGALVWAAKRFGIWTWMTKKAVSKESV